MKSVHVRVDLKQVPLFSFKTQLETTAESSLDVCGSMVEESINNHGLI